MSTEPIPFNKPFYVGTESAYIEEAVSSGWISASGDFGRRCQAWLESNAETPRALVAHSCTAALEAAMLLAGIGPGDEVIMPSYTFVTTASAVAIRGATPVFVDIRPDTLNIDERLIEAAITPRTKAIVPVHYAGVGCEMKAILEIAERHGLRVIEDAAQGILATYDGRPLGGIGDLGTLSFHETKNVTCGEGGALLVNNPEFAERSEKVWEKGTDRAQFARGEIDRYTWVEIGSSFGLGEVSAAFLWGQLEQAKAITARRLAIWDRYNAAFEELEIEGRVRRPRIPSECEHNGHMFHILLPDGDTRSALIEALAKRDIQAVFHYIPLHDSPAGSRFGHSPSDLPITADLSRRLLRLPLWAAMEEHHTDRVTEAVSEALRGTVSTAEFQPQES